MNVLLLRLEGPMQSWGLQSRFSMRDTGREPSKSGVIGLVCAALGRPRTANIQDLARLRMGVRADREGRIAYDYHTAQNVLKAQGGLKDTEPSRRYYLADACFLVGLAGEDPDLLQRIHRALHDPVWPLYLGRKAFVPSAPVWLEDGVQRDITLEEVLACYPWLDAREQPRPPERLRVVLEDEHGEHIRPDQPVSFATRRFAPRRVRIDFVNRPSATLSWPPRISAESEP